LVYEFAAYVPSNYTLPILVWQGKNGDFTVLMRCEQQILHCYAYWLLEKSKLFMEKKQKNTCKIANKRLVC